MDGIGWYPGGRRYRAPYGANNNIALETQHHCYFVRFLICATFYISKLHSCHLVCLFQNHFPHFYGLIINHGLNSSPSSMQCELPPILIFTKTKILTRTSPNLVPVLPLDGESVLHCSLLIRNVSPEHFGRLGIFGDFLSVCWSSMVWLLTSFSVIRHPFC